MSSSSRLPYPDANRLIGVWYTAPGINIKDLNFAPSHYFIEREQSKTLEDIGAYTGDAFNVSGSGEPEHVNGLDVTDGTLPLLGVKPALGRLFTRQDDTAAAPKTVVLSYGYWQKKFGGATSVIGKSLTMDGDARQIIGVLPRGFQFLDYDDVNLVIPMQWDRSKTKLGNYSYEALARLKPGVTMEQASADLARLIPITLQFFPPPDGFSKALFESAHLSPNLRPLKKDVIGDIGNVLWVRHGRARAWFCSSPAPMSLIFCWSASKAAARNSPSAPLSAQAGAAPPASSSPKASSSLSLGSLIGLGLAYAAAPRPRLGRAGRPAPPA